MSTKGKDYQVGYRKPPKARRFQKGRSGNPTGRPKQSIEPLSLGSIIEALDNEEIMVVENGQRKSMKKVEIEFRQQFTKAINGDLKTARLLVQMANDYFAPDETRGCHNEFMTRAQAKKRYGKNWSEIIDRSNALCMSGR